MTVTGVDTPPPEIAACYGSDMTEHALNHRFRKVRASVEIIHTARAQGRDMKGLTTDENLLPSTQAAIDKNSRLSNLVDFSICRSRANIFSPQTLPSTLASLPQMAFSFSSAPSRRTLRLFARLLTTAAMLPAASILVLALVPTLPLSLLPHEVLRQLVLARARSARALSPSILSSAQLQMMRMRMMT